MGVHRPNCSPGFLPPPPPYEPPSEGGEQGLVSYNQEAITDSEARASLNQLVSENCCWGKGPANDMKIVNIAPSSAFKVRFRRDKIQPPLQTATCPSTDFATRYKQ